MKSRFSTGAIRLGTFCVFAAVAGAIQSLADTPKDAAVRRTAEQIADDASATGADRALGAGKEGSGSVFNPKVDFRGYKRFAFARRPEETITNAEPGESLGNPFLEREIQRVIRTEMINRGFYPAATSEADFLVSLQVVGTSRPGYYLDSVGHVMDYNRFYSTWGAQRVIPTSRRKGTLIVDIIDVGLKELSWQGWSSEPIGYEKDRKEIIRKIVKDVVDRFPPNG